MRTQARGAPKMAAYTAKLALAGGLTLAGATSAARASVISATPMLGFSSTPAQLDLDGGVFTFTADTVPGDPPVDVSTGGGGEVSSIFGGIADFGAGASIDQNGELYAFAAYPTPAPIPYSAADDFIGLSITLSDGVHFGYAEVDGTELVSYGYESAADTTVLTGAVPEPATMALLGTGLAGLAGLRCRRHPRMAAKDGAAGSSR